MSKASEIFDGYKNIVFSSEEVEKMAKERMSICIDCTFFKKTHRCGICNCWMPAKTRSPKSKCPDNKW